jgi:hypothetical protein
MTLHTLAALILLIVLTSDQVSKQDFPHISLQGAEPFRGLVRKIVDGRPWHKPDFSGSVVRTINEVPNRIAKIQPIASTQVIKIHTGEADGKCELLVNA